MKILATFFGSIFWLAGTCQILTVDNNPTPLGGSYATLQAAYDDASPGDTLYLIPSTINYGDLSIAKQLTFFGGGYNPDSDHRLVSEVGVFNLNQGSSNTVLSGLKIHDLRLAYEAAIYDLDTIRVTHCHIDEVGLGESGSNSRNIDSLVFINNVFGNNGGGSVSGGYVDLVTANATTSRTYFYNNIFVGSNSSSGTISADTANFYNNLFYGAGATGALAFYDVTRSVFENNIFYGRAPSATSTLSNSYFNYNLSSDSTFTSVIGTSGNSGDANLNYTDPMFTSVSLGTVYDLDFDQSIMTGSSAENAGSDGTNIGPTGGTTPYDPTGTPLPVVTKTVISSVVTEGTDISITISGKGN